jgi:ferredoxin-NADP reductase
MPDIKLIERTHIADATIALTFEKPIGFSYRAGQAVDLAMPLLSEPDTEGNMRTLSLVSSPEEKVLTVATRLRDTPVKRALATLPYGEAVSIGAPYGRLSLPDEPEGHMVFVAGGIGITPFVSMLRHVRETAARHVITLFYSNRTPREAAFLTELQELATTLPTVTLVAIMTRPQPEVAWSGEQSRISGDLLNRYLGSLTGHRFFVAGPTGLVQAVRADLQDKGVPRAQIQFEQFAGY